MFSFVAGVIEKTGLAGVFALMLLENLLPFIPSELILPMAGFVSAKEGDNPAWPCILGALGSIIGGVVWYQIGRAIGSERLKRWASSNGRWLGFSAEDVERGKAWFARWGAAAVCVGRTLPGVRGVICLPAGLAKMPFLQFLFWSSVGATLWSVLLVLAGYTLKNHYSEVQQWLNPISDGLIILSVFTYLWRLLRHRKADERE